MRRILLLLGILFFVSCEDSTTKYEQRSIADAGRAFVYVPRPDAQSSSAPRDADPDESVVRIIDARPVVDVIVDVPPPPPVCERLGERESCNIAGIQGPCAIGERFCNITSWSECNPVTFPRMEVCDAIDNDCDGVVNESPQDLGEVHTAPQFPLLFRSCYTGPAGTSKNGVCSSGISFCLELTRRADAGVEVYYDYGGCEQQVLPSIEICDGADNDCDGNTDEGLLNVCGDCGEDPIEECDGHDNDCDGTIDENLLNVCGDCGEDPVEVCDTVDNDCDGNVDENLLNACGDCGVEPRELCDYLDNDCDGLVDEDFEEGDCVCDHPDYVPQPETCNGIDDDCDELIDEGLLGGPLTKLCSTDPLTGEVFAHDRREDGPQYVGGECHLGIAICDSSMVNGVREFGYFRCLQEALPGIERCNNEDDDCDGNIDENFHQGRVAVMMAVDISGSMHIQELEVAFNITRDVVRELHNQGVVDVCYMLAVLGNDAMPDPYLFAYAHNCVPGVEDPPLPPVEDMVTAVGALRQSVSGGLLNRGGATENTYDVIGKFFTDDLLDWNNDGVPDEVVWDTNHPWDRRNTTDLSPYTHRIIVILGDEHGQGAEFDEHTAAIAMARARGMVFFIIPQAIVTAGTYSELFDIGAVHVDLSRNWGNPQNNEPIEEGIRMAIEEAACINNHEEEPEEEADAGADAGMDAGVDASADAGLACYAPKEQKERGFSYGKYRLAVRSSLCHWDYKRRICL